jgi:hypothetical protein
MNAEYPRHRPASAYTRTALEPSSRHLEYHQLPQVVKRTESVEPVTMTALATSDEPQLVPRLLEQVRLLAACDRRVLRHDRTGEITSTAGSKFSPSPRVRFSD